MDNMKRGRIVSSDLTRKKIQDALRNKPSVNDRSLTPQQINASRKNIKKKDLNQNVIVNKIQRPRTQVTRRSTTPFLTNVPGKTTKLILPERGSFNAGILDLGDKILCVYRPDEIQLVSCFLNKDYSVIPDSFNRFSLLYAADPRLIITPDNKVLMSYSKYEIHSSKEHIDGNIIMDLNKSRDRIFMDKTIRISPEWMKNRQKNWMPFVHDKKLYFISTVCPHAIYDVDWNGKNESTFVYNTNWKNHWFSRESLRGNTNAVMLSDGNYLCTFHTATRIENCHFYDNGAYIFEGKPPFRPIFAGNRTFLRAEAAKEAHYRKEGLIVCTFPVGMILNDDNVIISYGDNDSSVKILETKLEEIKSTMLPVSEIVISKFVQSDNSSEHISMI